MTSALRKAASEDASMIFTTKDAKSTKFGVRIIQNLRDLRGELDSLIARDYIESKKHSFSIVARMQRSKIRGLADRFLG